MGLEWVLLSVLMAVVVWLGADASRETKRLHARLSRLQPHGPTNASAVEFFDKH